MDHRSKRFAHPWMSYCQDRSLKPHFKREKEKKTDRQRYVASKTALSKRLNGGLASVSANSRTARRVPGVPLGVAFTCFPPAYFLFNPLEVSLPLAGSQPPRRSCNISHIYRLRGLCYFCALHPFPPHEGHLRPLQPGDQQQQPGPRLGEPASQ